MELSYVTAGESHGPGLTVVVSGLPAGLELDHELIRNDLARRQAGYGRSPQKLETDDVEPRGGPSWQGTGTLGQPAGVYLKPGSPELAGADESVAGGCLRAGVVRLARKADRAPATGPRRPARDARTAMTTCAMCWSGPAPARPPPGSPQVRWPRPPDPHHRHRGALTRAGGGTVRATPPAWLSSQDFERAEASEVRCLDPPRSRP